MIGTPENLRVCWVWPSKYKGKWCNKVILKNGINNFLVETSLCQFSNIGFLRSGENVHLAILYAHKTVSKNVFLIKHFSLSLWQMLCHIVGWCYALADVIASFIVEDGISHGQMLLPIFYHLADVISLFSLL